MAAEISCDDPPVAHARVQPTFSAIRAARGIMMSAATEPTLLAGLCAALTAPGCFQRAVIEAPVTAAAAVSQCLAAAGEDPPVIAPQATLTVPIILPDERIAGFLTLHAGLAGAFGKPERDAFAQLGRDIGSRIAALRLQGGSPSGPTTADPPHLTQLERLFSEAMMESMPGIAYFYTQAGKFLRWNRNFMTASGYSAAEIAAMHPLDFFAGDDKRRLKERIERVFETGEATIEAGFLAKSGVATPYLFTGRRMAFDGATYLVGVGIDITKRKTAEAVLQEAQLRFETLFALCPVGLAAIDPANTRIMACNKQAAHQLGYDVDDMLRMRLADFTAPDEKATLRRHIDRLQADGRASFETRLLAKNGAPRDIVVQAQLVEFGGRPVGDCVLQDVTEQRKGLQALADYNLRLQAMSRQLLDVQEAERRRLARELHDSVGQELAALSLNLSLMRAALPEGVAAAMRGRFDDSQQLLEATTQHLRSLMVELRPFGLDELGLVAALKDHAQRVGQRSGLSISIEGSEPRPRLGAGVAIALFRIVQEALNNVVKHADASAVVIGLQDDGDRLALRIADDGRGFEPGCALPIGTSGMGTTTMRERAESIGARLRVCSAPGQGTSILVTLPRPSPAPG